MTTASVSVSVPATGPATGPEVKAEPIRTPEELALIKRAKSLIMSARRATEPSAHHALRKVAMDMRLTKVEVARRLIAGEIDVRRIVVRKWVERERVKVEAGPGPGPGPKGE